MINTIQYMEFSASFRRNPSNKYRSANYTSSSNFKSGHVKEISTEKFLTSGKSARGNRKFVSCSVVFLCYQLSNISRYTTDRVEIKLFNSRKLSGSFTYISALTFAKCWLKLPLVPISFDQIQENISFFFKYFCFVND